MSANLETSVDTLFEALPSEPTSEGENPSQSQETQTPEPSEAPAKDEAPGDGKAESDSQVFTVKIGDQEVEFSTSNKEIDIDHLKTGIMMKDAFYKKTEEISNERKAFQAKGQELDQKLQEVSSVLEFKIAQAEQLREEDPQAYYEKIAEIDKVKEQYQKFSKERTEELVKNQELIIKEEREKWTQIIPEWLDNKVLTEETQAISQLLVDTGFDPNEVQRIYDSRLVSLFRKAMLYEKAKTQPLQPTSKPQKNVKSQSTTASEPQEKEKSIEEIFYGAS